VLDRQGIRKLLVLNSHGGNNFRTMLRELGVQFPAMFLSSCDWFKALNKKLYFENEGDHADEMETSLIMHYRPELVDLSKAGPGKAKKIKVTGINEGWAWAERRWSQVTEDTGVGDPSLSTAEKGQRFHKDVTDKLAQLFSDICKLDLEDMYE
jgi:creatinine amidohydrolase